MNKLLIFFFLFYSFSLHSNEDELYRLITDNLPSMNTVNEVYMGDKMVEQRTGMFVECLVPKFSDSDKKFGGQVLIIEAEKPLCKINEKSKGYLPTYINGLQGTSQVEDMYYEVRLKGKKEGKLKLCLVAPPLNAHCKKKLSSDDFYYSSIFRSEKDTLQRVIEYAGKKGSIVKFIYSEFKDEIIRNAFTREFEIDLNDGNTVAYKGCIFEIIKVDNATIKYKVLKHFEN